MLERPGDDGDDPDPAAAGGGGAMGGTSHVPNVAFACSYINKGQIRVSLIAFHYIQYFLELREKKWLETLQ